MAGIVAAMLAGPASADLVCPDSSYCVVTFSNTFGGAWNNGADYDIVTINPDGQGETFAATGISISVYLKNCAGEPLVGIPTQEIVLFNSALCICPGGNISDAGTDANGCATFTGTISGGGCTLDPVSGAGGGLDVFADGVFVCTIDVDINSPDTGLASPCFTDASDLGDFASRLGVGANYSICSDYNESGPPTIDASDLGFFASALGASCQ
jgi:hypothetical protein